MKQLSKRVQLRSRWARGPRCAKKLLLAAQKFGTVQSGVPPILLGLITRRDLFGIISGVR